MDLKFSNHDFEDNKNVIGKRFYVSGLEIAPAKCKQMKTYVRAVNKEQDGK